jgi:hypothetical protein
MAVKLSVSIMMIFAVCLPAVWAQDLEPQKPFQGYPEITNVGDFLCKLTFWRGLPPCFNETVLHGSYVLYPTRQKARIIVDSFRVYGLYEQDLLVSFFGCLATGDYRPEPSIQVGDYWDSAYFGLVKLDHRIEAKRLLMDIVFDRDWAEGKFLPERYKALNVLASERIITLREYKPLVAYITEEVKKAEPDMNWLNSLVYALSSFREWNDELLPLFRQVLTVAQPGSYETVLQAFLDFDIPDEGEFILQQVVDGKIANPEDRMLCLRTAYVLDSEIAEIMLKKYLQDNENNDAFPEDMREFIVNTLERFKWFGNWEITDTNETIDPGLKDEKIAFKMSKSLNPEDDIVNFSMTMQISWDPGELKPIGLDETYETNYTSFVVTPDTLVFTIEYPLEHLSLDKTFLIKEGTGRNAGRIYLRFIIPGETDRRGNPKYGWIEVEKIS